MKVLISGTGGVSGWPLPDCGCASCSRLSPGHRRPSEIVLGEPGAPIRLPLPAYGGLDRLPLRTAADAGDTGSPPGYRAFATADGLVVTTPGGHRILYAVTSSTPHAGGGRTGDDTDDDAVCDLVLMDVLERPELLGELRRRGVVTERTHVVAVHVDHRVPSERELSRRALLWGVRAVPDGTVLDLGEAPPARSPLPRRTLLLGGSRSGKSAEAELRLAAEPEVVYVATGPSGAGDAEWGRRVRAHRERRPAHWSTVESTDLAGLLRTAQAPMLIDGLGTWVAAVFDECDAWSDGNGGQGTDGTEGGDGGDAVAARCEELVAAWRQARSRVVAVSDEVGLGVVPATSSGRMFRDVLGRLNQRLAAESEEVALVVAGRPLPLPL